MSEEIDDLLLFNDTNQIQQEEDKPTAAWEDEEEIEKQENEFNQMQQDLLIDDSEMKELKQATLRKQQKKQFDELWKQKEIEDFDDNEISLLKPTITRNDRGGKRKQNNEIEYTLMKKSMHIRKSNDIITAVQFHQKKRVFMSCGRDRYIHIFKLTHQDKMISMHDHEMDDPIENAKFVGNKIMMTFNKSFIKFIDLETFKINTIRKIGDYQCEFNDFYVGENYIALINAENLSSILIDKNNYQVVEELKGSKQILCATFHPKENVYITAGGAGVCNIWDLKTMRCRSLVHDDASNYTTSIAISQDGKYIATGSIE